MNLCIEWMENKMSIIIMTHHPYLNKFALQIVEGGFFPFHAFVFCLNVSAIDIINQTERCDAVYGQAIENHKSTDKYSLDERHLSADSIVALNALLKRIPNEEVHKRKAFNQMFRMSVVNER